jgi:hypothetical protein
MANEIITASTVAQDQAIRKLTKVGWEVYNLIGNLYFLRHAVTKDEVGIDSEGNHHNV